MRSSFPLSSYRWDWKIVQDRFAYLVQYWNSDEDVWSKVPAEPDGEPVENLYDRDKADSKAKSTDPSKSRDEVQPGHFRWPLKFWVKRIF